MAHPDPFFSVIIPNWNGKAHLPECLASLRRQTFRDFEIIMVDNGSTDDSVPYVQSEFPEVRLLQLARNEGFAAGVNHGIRAGKGRFLVLLNNDTEVEPHWLENLARAAQLHPDVAIFGSKLLNYYRRDIIDSAGDELDLALGPFKIGEGELSTRHSSARRIFGACGGGGCYKTELFDEIGMFDEDFFAYFEDMDLSFRANWVGLKTLLVPDAVIYHKVGGTSDANRERRDRFDIMRRRNFFFMIVKNYPLSFLVKYFPFIFASHCLLFLANILRGRFRVAFATQWQILKGLPVMMRKRRRILAGRRISNAELARLCGQKYGGWKGFFRKKLGRFAS